MMALKIWPGFLLALVMLIMAKPAAQGPEREFFAILHPEWHIM
jgi:hypothetical protein